MSKLQKEVKIIGLIVPDVHEQIVRLTKLLRDPKYKDVLWVVFLGDFMDTFDGLTWQTFEMVNWLSVNVQNPKYTFLWGNHDMHYAFPFDGVMCSGFDPNKLKIVKDTLNDKDHWQKFKLLHWIDTPSGISVPDESKGNIVQPTEWLLSHAGVHVSLLNPFLGFERQSLQALEEEAMYKLRYTQQVTPLIAAGRGRGGPARVGGVVWLDWTTEFQPISGLNQIVGHSYGKEVRVKKNGVRMPDSINYCVDTHLRHVVEVLENGTLRMKKIND